MLANSAGAALGSALVLVALRVWTLVDAIRMLDEAGCRAGTKPLWVPVIALTGLLGAAVYLAIGRPTRRPAPGRYRLEPLGERR